MLLFLLDGPDDHGESLNRSRGHPEGADSEIFLQMSGSHEVGAEESRGAEDQAEGQKTRGGEEEAGGGEGPEGLLAV